MTFTETALPGVYVIDIDRHEDDRGFFARTWCHEEMARLGINPRVEQCSLSFNRRRGTLRGMHYQEAPHAEAKIVRCTAGAVYDVALDLRLDSQSFARWVAVELSAESRRQLYIPEGCAHGFQTLMDDTELFYQISTPYNAESARGVRWDDPTFGITWPVDGPTLSERDRSFALLAADKLK